MENTEKVLFENDSPQWYVAVGDSYVGPLSAADVYRKISAQEISWAHYVWKKGQPEWKRLCDVKTFEAAVPRVPGKAAISDIKEISQPHIKASARQALAKTPQKGREWFLYYNDSQFGPFSKEEISRFIEVGKIHGRVHTWKNGMDNWQRIEKTEEFDEVLAIAPKKTSPRPLSPDSPVRAEMRAAPRRPLLAKIVMAHAEKVGIAVCRDISVGGMQVLTDQIPGAVGGKLRLNVSSSNGKIAPFVAEGTIVRILEDQRGFSFRFDRLDDSAKKTIEQYINSPD